MVILGRGEGSNVGNRIYLSPLQSNIRLLFERVNKLLEEWSDVLVEVLDLFIV